MSAEPGCGAPSAGAALRQAAAGGARAARPTAAGRRAGRPSGPGRPQGALPERFEPELATLVRGAAPATTGSTRSSSTATACSAVSRTGRASLFTRRGADWTSHFPRCSSALARAARASQALLDGEVVYVGDDGHTSFLQAGERAAGRHRPGRAHRLLRVRPALPGRLRPHRGAAAARKEALREPPCGPAAGARVRFVDHLRGQRRRVLSPDLRASRSRAPSPSGRRALPLGSRPRLAQDQVPAAPGVRHRRVHGARRHRAASARCSWAVHDEAGGPLRYAGRVGTGWDERRCASCARGSRSCVRTSRPSSTRPAGARRASVTLGEARPGGRDRVSDWRRRGMFRHPSFEGLRLDKPAAEVVPRAAGRGRAAPSGRRAPRPTPLAPRRTASGGATPRLPARPAARASGRARGRWAAWRSAIPTVSCIRTSGSPSSRSPATTRTSPTGCCPTWRGAAHHRPLPRGLHQPVLLSEARGRRTFPMSSCACRSNENGGERRLRGRRLGWRACSRSSRRARSSSTCGGRICETLEQPDQIVFDLDPATELPFGRVIEAARLMHHLLDGPRPGELRQDERRQGSARGGAAEPAPPGTRSRTSPTP